MSGGHLCEAEAPTEAAAEMVGLPQAKPEGEKGFKHIKALFFLSLSQLR